MSLKTQSSGSPDALSYEKAQRYIRHRRHVLTSKATINSHLGRAYLPKHRVFNQRKKFLIASKEQDIQQQNLKLFQRIQESKFNLSPIDKEHVHHTSLLQSKSRDREKRMEDIQSKNERLLKKLSNVKTNYDVNTSESVPIISRRNHSYDYFQKIPKQLLPKPYLRLPPMPDVEARSSFYTSHSLDIQSIASLQSSSLSSIHSLNLLDSIESKFGADFPPRHFTARDVFINRSKRFGTLNTRYHQSHLAPDPPPLPKERSRRELVRNPSTRIKDVTHLPSGSKKNVLSRIKFLSMVKENIFDTKMPQNTQAAKMKHHSMVSHRHSLEVCPIVVSHTTNIASRVFAIPFDSNNCTIDVFVRTDTIYDENFGVRLLSPSQSSEQFLSIDQVIDILENHQFYRPIREAEEKHSIRFLFINIFRSHDFENSGWILYDKFAELLLSTRIGVSSNQIR